MVVFESVDCRCSADRMKWSELCVKVEWARTGPITAPSQITRAVFRRVNLKFNYKLLPFPLLDRVFVYLECASMVPYEPATTNGHISRKNDPSRLAPEDAFYAKRLKDGARNSSRKRKGAWKKLLWVKQSCMSPPS